MKNTYRRWGVEISKVPNNCCENGKGAINCEKNAFRNGKKLNANSYEGSLFSRLGRKTRKVNRVIAPPTIPIVQSDHSFDLGNFGKKSRLSSSKIGESSNEYS